MPHRKYPQEFAWLIQLAEEVDALKGYIKREETAAIYCPACETIQAYCTGCGESLFDVYDEDTDSCSNCGISLEYCSICGVAVVEMNTAPDHIAKPEYWKYCPACGESIFAVTDMCPHCKVSMSTHLDRVYEETYNRVNQTVINEELRSEGQFAKKKPPAEPRQSMSFIEIIRMLLGLD